MKIHQVGSETVLEFIKRNPGVPLQRINLFFGKVSLSRTLHNLEGKGLVKSKIEAKGINRNWMVKCYYSIS